MSASIEEMYRIYKGIDSVVERFWTQLRDNIAKIDGDKEDERRALSYFVDKVFKTTGASLDIGGKKYSSFAKRKQRVFNDSERHGDYIRTRYRDLRKEGKNQKEAFAELKQDWIMADGKPLSDNFLRQITGLADDWDSRYAYGEYYLKHRIRTNNKEQVKDLLTNAMLHKFPDWANSVQGKRMLDYTVNMLLGNYATEANPPSRN